MKPEEPLPDVTFVPVDPLTVSLGPGSANRHLRFRAELEVEPGAKSDVTAMLPRVLDVLNGYLRAVSITDLEQLQDPDMTVYIDFLGDTQPVYRAGGLCIIDNYGGQWPPSGPPQNPLAEQVPQQPPLTGFFTRFWIPTAIATPL